MNTRQAQLFIHLLQEHIRTARPVGSQFLVDKYSLEVSPATVRNDLLELEQEGFLRHPHTSSGKVPTEKGYRYYLKHFAEPKELSLKERDTIRGAAEESGRTPKNVAKKLAEMTSESVVMVLAPDDLYYTGLSYLFQKPEFADVDALYTMSDVIDHLDETFARIMEDMEQSTQVFIGSENPLSENCSIIATKFSMDENKGIACIFGPMRMDYERNIPRLEFSVQFLENMYDE